jgi:hypothetical protein
MTRAAANAVRAGVALAAAAGTVGAGGCGPGGAATTDASAPGRGRAGATTAAVATAPGTAEAAERREQGAAWSYAKLTSQLHGRVVRVGDRRVVIDRRLLLCSGDGAPRNVGGSSRWSRFTCTQTLFTGGVDRDVTFDVSIVDRDAIEVGAARYGPD